MLVGVDVVMSGIQLGRVANATDLGWCSHWEEQGGERRERGQAKSQDLAGGRSASQSQTGRQAGGGSSVRERD